MFQHKLNEQVDLKTYFDWFVLSFLAGNFNAGGYISCNRFVSHVTGFATLSGISLEQGSFFEALGMFAHRKWGLSVWDGTISTRNLVFTGLLRPDEVDLYKLYILNV